MNQVLTLFLIERKQSAVGIPINSSEKLYTSLKDCSKAVRLPIDVIRNYGNKPKGLV